MNIFCTVMQYVCIFFFIFFTNLKIKRKFITKHVIYKKLKFQIYSQYVKQSKFWSLMGPKITLEYKSICFVSWYF